VAGEGLAGILVAVLVTVGVAPKAMEPRLAGLPGEVGALVVGALLCAFLHRAGRDGRS
jgi:hypothetical protein